jgi:hypothetical protein
MCDAVASVSFDAGPARETTLVSSIHSHHNQEHLDSRSLDMTQLSGLIE